VPFLIYLRYWFGLRIETYTIFFVLNYILHL